MGKPKKKPKKRKGRVRISKKTGLVRKDNERSDSLSKAPIRIAGDNGANFKIKIRRK